MKSSKKTTVLRDYDSYEQIPASIKAWITMDAIKAGKNPVMAHAGYKAAFKKMQNQTTITILQERDTIMDDCCRLEPVHHIIKANSPVILKEKVAKIYDNILLGFDKDSKEYKQILSVKKSNIISLIDDREEINVAGVSLQIISNPDFVHIC